ncbi:rac GTPase-activating protein 1 [Odontesthes bonariensis]
MEETRLMVEELRTLCLQRISMEETAMNTELEFAKVVKNFEVSRKTWLRAELELKRFKELLVKSDVAKAALEVKLKHARNQLDVEMKKRYKMEADYQYLKRQMQLMCDILVHDSKSSACLNEEQKSLLANFEHRGANVTLHRSSKRLSVIDESSFLSHSDISYDRTDEEVDLDSTVIKPLRSRARERRRSSMLPALGAPVGKRSRSGNVSAELLERKTVEKEVETIVKASVTTPDTGSQIHMVLGITQESPDPSDPRVRVTPGRTMTQECAVTVGGADQTSVWFPSEDTVVVPEAEAPPEDRTVYSNGAQRILKHVFLSKTVIRPETCTPCGKRIRFGKMAVKCRNCRVAAHPECEQKLTNGCSASNSRTGSTAQKRGLYRVPGGERPVKELRERFLQGKSALMLGKVQDIHVVCGVLKDFLRRLKEPLITFRLHRTFMEASELAEDKGSAVLHRAVAELPKANRDTLAFLMLHLHKVMRSPQCQMDQNNLARVFGPTIVGHGMPEPSPTTILRDTSTQPKVICRLLSIPQDYWRRVLSVRTDQIPPASSRMSQDEGQGRLFKPLTSPELNGHKTPSAGSVRGRIGTLNAITSMGLLEPGGRFFTSPT